MTRRDGHSDAAETLASFLESVGALLRDLRANHGRGDARAAVGDTGASFATVSPPSPPPGAAASARRDARESWMTEPPFEPRLADVHPGDDISLLLNDARARAQAIIDESIERAQELL